MTINNAPSNVPASVRSVFDSDIPFGSDFVYYCVENSYGNGQYVALYRKIGTNQINQIRAVRQTDGTYQFTYQSDISGDFSGITTAHPEYVYTSLSGGVGQFYELPSGHTLMILCVVVLASLAILKTVFGGIKWFRSRKYRV